MFNHNTESVSIGTATLNNSNYYSKDSNEWFGSFWNWFCSEKNSGGKVDDEQCQKEDSSWGNDSGCLSSDEIWKKWYCN
jgi:hypothetical protein